MPRRDPFKGRHRFPKVLILLVECGIAVDAAIACRRAQKFGPEIRK